MRLLIPLFIIFITGNVMAETNNLAIPAPEATPETTVARIRQLNTEYIEAARTGDADWFRRHMADDVIVITGSAQRLDKQAFLALFDTPSAFRSLTVRNVTVRIFGTMAQVDADAPWELDDGRKGISRYIDTYVWLDDRWQVVSAQITYLDETGHSQDD